MATLRRKQAKEEKRQREQTNLKKWFNLSAFNCDRKRTRSRKYYKWVKAQSEAKIEKELQKRVIVVFD